MAEIPSFTLVPYPKCINFNNLVRIVIVGPHIENDDSNVFIVHRDILAARSLIFRQHFSNDPGCQSIPLPEFDKLTFQLYLQLMYTSEIACAPEIYNSQSVLEQQYWLANLYVLCSKLQDGFGKNRALQALHDSIYYLYWMEDKWVINRDMVEVIYHGTMKGSLARQLLVDIFYHGGECGISKHELESFPPEFQEDLCVVKIAMCKLDGMYAEDNSACINDIGAYLEDL